MEFLPPALQALEKYAQFIVYKLLPNPDKPEKLTKKPLDFRTLHVSNPTDGSIWTTFSTAAAVVKRLDASYGVGFVLTESDPFFLLDLDECLDKNGIFCVSNAGVTQELLSLLSGAAVEKSSSNRGLHIIGSAIAPAHRSRSAVRENLELYSKLRFIALTGVNTIGDVGFDCTSNLAILIEKYFNVGANDAAIVEWTNSPREEWHGPADDEELIARALRSVSKLHAFNGKATFSDLWEANAEVLIESYPSATHGSYDGNRADAALAQHLAYWTGCNADRMLSLMSKSKLDRGKWGRADYLPRTILNAIRMQKEVLHDKAVELHVPQNAAFILTPRVTEGAAFLTIEHQQQLFAGCAYVEDEHKVLVPNGKLLKPEQFKTKYAGYIFSIESTNTKVTTDAWKAFTESQGYRAPRVDSYCFRPSDPPGKIIFRDGLSYVNTWWPIAVPRAKGDPTPFLNHLHKLFPHGDDAVYLLSYFAALCQHPGIKFGWCPLIQGVEGNGKSLLIQSVIRAIGKRYVWQPEAKELLDKWNNWMYGTLLIVIEEMHVPEHQKEILETMKTRITSSDLEMQQKYSDRKMQDICCNFILTSNHKDAIPRTEDMRRYAIFFAAQQSSQDLVRDKMPESYFRNYLHWLERENGHAIVTELLYTYKIPDDMNPAVNCLRAPRTSTTNEAITESRGAIAQEVLEAVEQDLVGFRGGWISSTYLQHLLTRLGYTRFSHSKRKELLKSLSYDAHPGLDRGRVNNPVMPDNARSQLFIKRDHPAAALTGSVLVAKAYEDAQNP